MKKKKIYLILNGKRRMDNGERKAENGEQKKDKKSKKIYQLH